MVGIVCFLVSKKRYVSKQCMMVKIRIIRINEATIKCLSNQVTASHEDTLDLA